MWTDERVETMTADWAGGASAGQIAAKLGGFEHTADKGRSAVLGKLHRLGLSRSRETNAQRDGRIDKRRRAFRAAAKAAERAAPIAAPKAATLPPIDMTPTPPEPDVARVLSVLDLEYGHCRWPVEHAGGTGFCGCPAIEGKPYCAGHSARSYTKPAPKLPMHHRPAPHVDSRPFRNATRWT